MTSSKLEKENYENGAFLGQQPFGLAFFEVEKDAMPWSPGMTSSVSVMNRGYAFRQYLNQYVLSKLMLPNAT